jgi:osmoprotectant transport system ATP-binding protein
VSESTTSASTTSATSTATSGATAVDGDSGVPAAARAASHGERILLDGVTKRYPGQHKAAVDDVTLEIPAGEIVMLVGPSGCGKTTTMKMINRLIEPTGGRILIGEEDVTHKNADDLRRRIGYVIQGAGLFPHYTVGDNIGLVPNLLKWDKSRTRKRVEELLDMVGLDPGQFRDRYPRQLSGGQQQRVGVARALAADPPVLLMDEPFGAVDPITRQRLQDELLRLQEELRKTIVFVTHDFDEAVKLGDRIAILQEGSEVVQYDTPEQILAAPANDFVEGFVGSGAALKQLTLTRVRDVDLHEAAVAKVGGDARSAITKARELGRKWVIVLDEEERPQRWVPVEELERSGTLGSVTRNLDLEVVNTASTLQDALDEMLTSSHGVVVVTGRRNRYEGVIRVETIMAAMQSMQSAAHRAETVTPTGARS